ncbi:MAG: AGE family epimerase/isomerase [Opitutaceae bacterium]|nr:AGE family epimerase/isomerase [Opitutaceae bacterium]
MDPRVIEQYATRIEADLEKNILPFWMRHAVDRRRGGFVGALSDDLVVSPAPSRGALLSSRILWTYAAAHRRRPDPALLDMARHAYADLMETFADRDHGGFIWSVDDAGRPLERRKQVYGQAFAIYALTEYHRATGERAPLEAAIAVFRLLEQHARDRRHGGYFEAYAGDWSPIADMRLSAVDMNEPKSQNTHLHVMEAYSNLMRVWPDPVLREAQTALLEVMLTRIVDARTWHLGLFFSETWDLRSDRFSFGHDIEASWLLWEAAEVLGDPAMAARMRPAILRIAEVTLAEGLDADGAVFNEGGPAGLTSTDKEWWPQAEAVVGFLNAFQLTLDERFLAAALKCWDFIDAKLIDHRHGEWIRGVTRDGAVLPGHPKISFWKCPYHNGRACMEASVRLRALT